MLAITGGKAELIHDPFGILPGQRFELFLDIEVDEEDELFSEKGLYIRVIYAVEEGRAGIVKYALHEKSTENYLEFELEEEELALVEAYCKDHLPVAE